VLFLDLIFFLFSFFPLACFGQVGCVVQRGVGIVVEACVCGKNVVFVGLIGCCLCHPKCRVAVLCYRLWCRVCVRFCFSPVRLLYSTDGVAVHVTTRENL